VMTPRLVKQVVAPDGDVIAKMHPRVYSHAVKPKTAAAIRDMMVAAVQGGTGTKAQIPGVTVAGKTGTAQWGGTEKHKEKQRYAAWFAGFAPAENPIYAFSAIYESERGQTKIHGGHYAAPMIGRVLRENLKGVEKKKPGKDEPEEMASDEDNQD